MLILEKIHKTQILLLMVGMMILGASATDIYIASLPQMVADFHCSPKEVNLTISSYGFGIALVVLFIGEISNRFGRRKILVGGIGLFSFASFLIALMPSIHLMIALRLVQALGCATFLIVPRLILKDCMNEREQVNANGILLMGLIISPALAPVIGAYLAEYLGWKSCFIASGIFGGILCYLSLKMLPETNLSPIEKFSSLLHYLKIYYQLLSNRVFITLTAIYASAIGAYFAFIGISSYLYIDYWHLTPIDYSYIFILLSIAYLVGNVIMRKLNRRKLSIAKIIGFGTYSTLGGMLLIILAAILLHGKALIVVVTIGALFMRTANALINPPTQIRIMSEFHPHSAQALGLNMCISFLINSFSTYVVTITGLNPFMSLVLVSGIMVAICVLFYRANFKLL